MPTAYDSVRYVAWPYPQTDPAALGVIAKLLGLPFAPFETCRMLDIGCGEGVNLINLALSAPRARFVGVDLAETAVAAARAEAAACGLTNIEFILADLRDIGPAFGEFDYIVAHGVLSWVPQPVGEVLFEVIGARLAPGGLAMVSFVALPGGRAFQAIRDVLAYETREATSPQDKLNRAAAILESFLELWPDQDVDAAHMKVKARRLLAKPRGVLFHDELGEAYEPRLLADVAASAAASGLSYFADARPRANTEALFPSESAAFARERADGDWTRMQQYLDFQHVRSFHNAVFVKGGAPDRRRSASRLQGLWMQCDITEDARVADEPAALAFVIGQGARLTTNDPRLAALFRKLASAYPEALPLAEVADLEAIADHVLKLFANQVARLSTAPSRACREPGPRPLASPLARRQAARGEREIATLMQTVARLEDEALVALLALLDGARTRRDLVEPWVAAAGLDKAEASAALDSALAALARAGLLMSADG